MQAAGTRAYLINTGWNGRGERISLPHTRALIDAIFSGEIDQAETETLPVFGLKMPKTLPVLVLRCSIRGQAMILCRLGRTCPQARRSVHRKL